MSNTPQTEIIRKMLEVMESAISSKDWIVDGACDPDTVMADAEEALKEAGYCRDGLTGTEWIYC